MNEKQMAKNTQFTNQVKMSEIENAYKLWDINMSNYLANRDISESAKQLREVTQSIADRLQESSDLCYFDFQEFLEKLFYNIDSVHIVIDDVYKILKSLNCWITDDIGDKENG